MSTMKEFQFPVSVRWRGGRLARATARSTSAIEVATPPELRDGLTGYWSPEDLLVGAAASCFALTLAAVAERRELPLLDATVHARGHVGQRCDGRLGFTVIELDADLETIPGCEEAVERAVRTAEQRCLVADALDTPVHVTASIRAVPPVAVSSG